MSGFAALHGADARPGDAELLERLTAAMSHAGPDRRATWSAEGVALGHALLGATPDLDPAEEQPCSLDGTTWIAADARIDGRRELAAALSGRGREVEPDAPDAHLILHAHAAWGEGCLDRLVGDFAFAIWDASTRRLFCARDHFGVVPLYYARCGAGLAAGNVLSSLLLHPDVSGAIDRRAIGDYLIAGMKLDPEATSFADVRSVPPGHCLTHESGAPRLRRYWRPEPESEARRDRPEEHVERFRAVFDEAVGDRLRTARAGTHLSGGMDSTSIAASAKHVIRARGEEPDLRAYTIVYEDLVDEEEGRWADLAAEFLDVPIEHLVAERWLTSPAARPGPPPVEPGLGAQASPEYEISARVSGFARSLLTGFGGDPLFTTSPTRPSGAGDWSARVRFAASSLRSGRLPRFGVRTTLRRVLGRGAPSAPPLPDWITPAFAREVGLPERWRELAAASQEPATAARMVHPTWTAIFTAAHPGASLLPVRTLFPFFDVRLAREVWSAPHYPWRQQKRLLRDAMRGRLPGAVIERPKTPLYSPNDRRAGPDPRHRLALDADIRRLRAEALSVPALAEFVDVGRALALIESPPPGRQPVPVENCLAVAGWLRTLPGPVS